LDWISEPTILNFRVRIGYGVYEKISDPIRLQNFHIRTPLVSSPELIIVPVQKAVKSSHEYSVVLNKSEIFAILIQSKIFIE